MLLNIISRKRWNIYWWLKRTLIDIFMIIDRIVEIATLTFICTDLSWYWTFGEPGCTGNHKTCKSKIHKLALYLEHKDSQQNQP